MIPFADVILKAIHDFKLLLRKLYPTREASNHIKNLRLKRIYIREASDIELYDTAMRIIEKLEEYVATHGKSKSYFGPEGFLNYLKNILAIYAIEDNKVIHPEHEVTRAVVAVIQLITLDSQTKEQAEELIKYANLIKKYGTLQHISIFNSVIKRNKKNLLLALNRYGIPTKVESLLIEE